MSSVTAECILWHGYVDKDGYGQTKVKGKTASAHRAAYEAAFGPVPDGLVLDHLCRTRACVNPWHLQPVTNRENLLRGDTHAARNARKTHCLRGHELSSDNVYVTSSGSRNCLACGRIRASEYLKRVNSRNGS